MSRASGLTAITGIIAGVAACAVGPNYQAPAPQTAAIGPLLSVAPEAATPAPTPDPWWRLYEDARLSTLLEEAFHNNHELAAAEANLAASRAVLEAARAGRYPSTLIHAGAIYGRDATTDLVLELTGREPVNDWVFDALFDVSYEVDLFGRVRRSIEAARAGAEAQAAARDALRVTIAAETARAFAEICTLGEQIVVQQHAIALVQQEANITASTRDAGGASDFEVVRAEAVVAQVRATLPPLEGQRRSAVFALAALLGRAPVAAPQALTDCATPPQLKSLLPVGDGAQLLRRRPDIREAERTLAAATAEIGVATAELFPTVRLTGLGGTVSDKVALLGTKYGGTWGLGPTITWQFPNIATPLAGVHRAQAQAQAALASFDESVLAALKETEQALSIYTAELQHRQALVDYQSKARRSFELAREQYAAGAVSNLDLLTSEVTLVNVDAQVASSDGAIVQDQITVFKALGGGWGGMSP